MIWRDKASVLVVCTGNICRSPTADGVLRQLVREAGFERVLDMIEAGARGVLGELRAALKAS